VLSAQKLFDLTGRTALVTGAAGAIGAGLASALVANGASVLLADRDAASLKAVAIGLEGNVIAGFIDVTDAASVAAVFDRAESQFGPVDIVVNAAGLGRRSPALEDEAADWRSLSAVNVEGAFTVAREAASRLIAAGRPGSIVNVSSFLAERPLRNTAAYAASKAALEQMTRSLALEWARNGIRVNAIAPGWVRSPMTEPFLGGRAGEVMAQTNPMRRLGTPEDLAGAVLLLASEAGRYITGTTIRVDGGQAIG
jgi:NAD(P)-dependent dehydrogenase (short-subunit alcohol dehydrogenase family)